MQLAISSILSAFGQLTDPAILRVLGKSFAITLAAFAIIGGALAVGIYRLMIWWGFAGSFEVGAILGVLAAILLGWLLFRVVAIAVLQFFADEVVAAVESRHYPDAATKARKLPFREDLANSLRGMGRTLAFNALTLPLALILLFTAIGPAILFLLVNAVLLGRELTDMGWLRHRTSPQDRSPVGPFERLALGGAIAGLMLIPFVNILAPIIGAAAGTHMVQNRIQTSHD